MGDGMMKVYCDDCKHFLFGLGSDNFGYRCHSPHNLKDTPTRRNAKFIMDSEEKNSENDCEDFEKKVPSMVEVVVESNSRRDLMVLAVALVSWLMGGLMVWMVML